MIATHFRNFQSDLEAYMDKVCDNQEALLVTYEKNRNVVLLSEDSYNNMLENMYIMSNREYYSSLLRAKDRIEDHISKPCTPGQFNS